MARILVVDDDMAQRTLYEQELADEGYEVVLAEDALQAMEYLKTQQADLIVLDICMPGIDGIDLLWRVLAKDRTTPIVLNTAYSQYRDNYLTWPANAYVVKSGDLSELKAKIREQLEIFHKIPADTA